MSRSRDAAEREVAYAVSELHFRRDLLLELAPASENPAFLMWRVRALEAAVAALRRPRFDINPFV